VKCPYCNYDSGRSPDAFEEQTVIDGDDIRTEYICPKCGEEFEDE
jgi:transcriptional regulator NrdR family protein